MKKSDESAQLLTGVYHDDWAGGVTADFARQAATMARQRQARRKRHFATTLAIAAATALLLSVNHQSDPSVISKLPSEAPPAEIPGYEIISDEQLVAELRDQAILIIPNGEGGTKIVIVGN